VRLESRTASTLDRTQDENKFEVEDPCPLKLKENGTPLEPPKKLRCTHPFFRAISAGVLVTAPAAVKAIVIVAKSSEPIHWAEDLKKQGMRFIKYQADDGI
jgi:hypothetical protein